MDAKPPLGTTDHFLTVEEVRRHLDYDPETGRLSWKEPTASWCRAGDEAGGINAEKGYRMVTIKGHIHSAGRLIWLWVTGAWPAGEVDHKNRVRHDNRWSNLRDASKGQNQANSSLRKDSTTGRKGVSHAVCHGKRNGHFMAYIQVNGRQRYLGVHRTFEAACAARERAEIELQGEFRCQEF